MKILIVSQYFRPDITAAAFRIADTADLLDDAGHEVAVLCAVPHKANVAGATPERTNYPVTRVSIAALARGGLLAYLRHYLSFVVNSTWHGLGVVRRLRPDVIWVSSPPLFAVIVGVLLARVAGASLVVDIRDIWPESAAAAKQISPHGRAFRIGKRMERWAYRHADAITCVSRPMAEYLTAISGKPATVVYNGVRRSVGEDLSADMDHDAGSPKRRIVYAGNLGRAQGLEAVVRAFSAVAADPDTAGWTLEFIGSGALEGALRELAGATACSDRILFTPPVSKLDALRRMRDASLLFINLDPDPIFDKTIPSKVFDYMLVGRPILAGLRGEGASILARTGGNVVFEPSNIQSVSQALLSAIRNWSELSTRAVANRAIALEEYSREEAVVTLASVLQGAVKRSAR